MKLLAIEASASDSSVALFDSGDTMQRTNTGQKAHSDTLLKLVDELLLESGNKLQDLDGIAFGRGPGGFTGVRIATALAQGLAYTSGLPLAPISSLLAIAQATDSQQPVLVCTDARKQQVYTVVVQRNAAGVCQLMSAEQVCNPGQVSAIAGNAVGVGSGFEVYPELRKLVTDVDEKAQAEARWVAVCAAADPSTLQSVFEAQPVYVRDKVTHGA